MFRRFAGAVPNGAEELFKCHPAVLMTLLEVAWEYREKDDLTKTPVLPLGHPGRRSAIGELPDYWLVPLREAASIFAPTRPVGIGEEPTDGDKQTVLWDHLIYAYMIENTRIYEIFRRVLYEFLHGEKLGPPTEEAQFWLRNTEELFFRDPPSFSITNITSHIRSDMRASRRNAYHRMFGMDLNHGTDDSRPYPYVKAEAYNNEFVTIFEEFLRESWIAISNFSNTSGANPTDQGKMNNLAANLQNMLMSRRTNGNLSREEFVFVSMMSWFHLTVEFNSSIVQSLRAEAGGAEQRLFKIAQRVGLPAHGLSKSYFDIADPISRVLIQIEASGTGIVPALVATKGPANPTPNEIQRTVNDIITHWSLITGRDMKAGKVAVR